MARGASGRPSGPWGKAGSDVRRGPAIGHGHGTGDELEPPVQAPEVS